MTLNVQNPEYLSQTTPPQPAVAGGDPNEEWLARLKRLQGFAYPQAQYPSTPPIGGPAPAPPPLTPAGQTSPAPVASPQPYNGPTAAADAAGPRGPEWTHAPWPSQAPASTQHPVLQPHPAVVAAAANALPKAAQGPPQKNPFTQIASPNMTGMGGALGRGGARPMMSALDLSSLFGNHPNPT